MPNLLPRLIAALLWLSQSFNKLKTHKYGRVGFYVLIGVFGLVVASPVFAAEGLDTGFMNTALLFFSNVAISVAVLLSKLVIAIIEILIPIMQYNNFSTSPVVSMGWAIVRDTVNMFFVVVLIVIAFGTIFGHSKFQWQQQIPRLMIFALVINFSKTLCGLMIDVGQVVMLTFANALREVAAGNFLQMLGLTDIYSLSTSNSIFIEASKSAGAQGVKAFDWFASSVAAVFMMLIVFVTMLMLLVILVYRIVMLWILIVISPLAWFVGGAKDIIKSGPYDQWWERFKCLVVIGPILTFFLWLTLVVAGAGDISTKSGFQTAGDASMGNDAGGFVTKIFQLDKLISFVIGIAMLFAGFEAAQAACSDSFIGKALQKGSPSRMSGIAKGAAVGAAGFGLGVAAKGTGWAARKTGAGIKLAGGGVLRKAGAAVEDKKAYGLQYLTKKGRAGLYKDIARGSGDGFVGRTLGRKAEQMAGGLAGDRKKEIEKAGEKYKDDTTESKVNQLKRFAANKPISVGGQREAQALMMQAMKDPAMMKQLRASGDFGNVWDKYGKDLEKDVSHDDAASADILKFKKTNADLTGSAGLLNSEEDIRNLSPEALANDQVRSAIEELKIRGKGGEMVSAAGLMEKGYFGKKEADIYNAAKEGKDIRMDKMSESELRQVPSKDLVEKGSAEAIARGVEVALMNGNSGKSDRILSKLLAKLQDADTSDKDKDKINSALKAVKTGMATALADGNLGGQERADRTKLLSGFDARKASADRTQRTHEYDSTKKGDFSANPLNTEADVARFTSDLHLAPQHAQAGADVLSTKRDEAAAGVAPAIASLKESMRADYLKLMSAESKASSPQEAANIRVEIENIKNSSDTLSDIQKFSSESNNPDSINLALHLASTTEGVPPEVVQMLEKQNVLSQGVERLTTLINKMNSPGGKA